jgi:photosystem II stability/assembly factor-like uncharacterized protein
MNRQWLLCGILAAGLISGIATVARANPDPNLNGLSYRAIGPAISGGRTTAVVGSDSDPLFYLAGGADGGVFKSTDGGSVWTPIFDRADAAAIGAIAAGPTDSSDIWVATGESNPRNDVAMGDGIWHSADGGTTWKHVGLNDAGSISSISIDPRDARRVVVGVLGQVFRDSHMRGVYVTSDGGAHWKQTLYLGSDVGVSDLIRMPGNPDTLFAGLWEVRRKPWTLISGGTKGGIFRSDDGGTTWRQLQGHGLPSPPTGRIGFAVSGSRVYAIIQSKAGDLWRSDDSGANWRLMPHSPYVGSRPFYFSSITADPANADRIIDVGNGLSMSTNGGHTFHQISSNAGYDFHIVWWSHDGKRIAVGSDEGLVLSSDDGVTWRQPYELPFSQVYHVGIDTASPNYHVCVGLQDTNQWCGPANSDSGLGVLNRDWWSVGPGDGMWVEFDPLDPHLIWSTSTNSDLGQVFIWDSRTQQAYEVSPDSTLNYLPPYMLKYRFNWDPPLVLGTDGKALLGGNVVFESSDRGEHWNVISPDLTRDEKSHQQIPGGPIDADLSGAETSDTILSIARSPVDSATVWVGTDDGLVQLTRDAGSHWSNVTPPQAPYWGRVATVEPGHFDAAAAFAAVDNHMLGDDGPHLFATHNFGKTWRSISGDLPSSLFVRCVRQDIANPNLLYAGTQRGVWASRDGGNHWRSLQLNMPPSAVYDIEIQPQADDLIVGSHGRGVWILDDLHPLQQLSWTNTGGVMLFAPRDTYRWWQWAPINAFKDNTLPANVFVGPNTPYGALITYWLGPEKHRSASIDILDARGRVVRRLRGDDVPRKSGFNRTAWDLTESAPVKWLGTYEENRGPASGAEVLPATYTIRLRVDGVTQEQNVLVKADPRDPLALDAMRSRYQTLSALYAQLSDVDSMLNRIDRELRTKLTTQRRASLQALHSELTSDPKNVEDLSVIATPLRDRLNDLITRISGTSYQAPTASQLETAASLHTTYTKLVQVYHSLI